MKDKHVVLGTNHWLAQNIDYGQLSISAVSLSHCQYGVPGERFRRNICSSSRLMWMETYLLLVSVRYQARSSKHVCDVQVVVAFQPFELDVKNRPH